MGAIRMRVNHEVRAGGGIRSLHGLSANFTLTPRLFKPPRYGPAWSSKVHFLNFLLNIYGVPFFQFWFQIKFTPITGELFMLWHLIYILSTKTLIYRDFRKAVCFVAPRPPSRAHKTHCFPPSQLISDKCILFISQGCQDKMYMRVKVAVQMSQDKHLWLAGWNPDQSEIFICDVGTAAVIPHAATFTLWCMLSCFSCNETQHFKLSLIIPKCSD